MNITKVELWMNQCYSCHSKEYQPLHDWFLSLGLPLTNFKSVRVPLNPEWQAFANKMAKNHINLPFVVIHTDGEVESFVYEYEQFAKAIKEGKDMNITVEQLEGIRKQLLVKEEKEKAVEVVSMKKKATRKKNTAVKKGKTATTAVD